MVVFLAASCTGSPNSKAHATAVMPCRSNDLAVTAPQVHHQGHEFALKLVVTNAAGAACTLPTPPALSIDTGWGPNSAIDTTATVATGYQLPNPLLQPHGHVAYGVGWGDQPCGGNMAPVSGIVLRLRSGVALTVPRSALPRGTSKQFCWSDGVDIEDADGRDLVVG
jgi:hypothetical protein